MDQILQDLSSPALVSAIEANSFELFLLLRHWPQAVVYDDPHMLWSITSVPFPLFNSVLRAQLAPSNADVAIETAIARGKSRNVPVLWWIGPATQPTNLGALLAAHGFSHSEENAGMAADLQSLNENVSTPPELIIEQVKDIKTMKQWCQTYCAGFGTPDFVGDAFLDLSRVLSLETGSLHHYISSLNGVPVATSSLFLGGGVAGIYNVATIPEARQKGIGAAMTLRSLREARALGYRVGILHAAAVGVSIYRKLGFREYCKINQYVWTDEHASSAAG